MLNHTRIKSAQPFIFVSDTAPLFASIGSSFKRKSVSAVMAVLLLALLTTPVYADSQFAMYSYYGSTRYINAEISGTAPIDCTGVYIWVYSDGQVATHIEATKGPAAISTSTGNAVWTFNMGYLQNGTYSVTAEAYCPTGTQYIQKSDAVRVVQNGCQNGPYCVPVFRFYNTANGSHFYTSNDNEKRQVLRYPQYRYEGMSFFAEKVTRDGVPLTPVHRFYDKTTGAHFYTGNQSEATYVNDNLWRAYRYEGVEYYAYTQPYSPIPSYLEASDYTASTHRFYKFQQGVHFYTINQTEASQINNYQYNTYRYEGATHYLIRN